RLRRLRLRHGRGTLGQRAPLRSPVSSTDGPAPAVSVIIPVRNRRDLLRRTLEALDRQELRDFEVIVVDDGSTDGADAEAASAVVAGRPVRLLRNPGRGAVAARQAGVAAARADLLAFTDSDCEPAPAWLAVAVGHLGSGAHL